MAGTFSCCWLAPLAFVLTGAVRGVRVAKQDDVALDGGPYYPENWMTHGGGYRPVHPSQQRPGYSQRPDYAVPQWRPPYQQGSPYQPPVRFQQPFVQNPGPGGCADPTLCCMCREFGKLKICAPGQKFKGRVVVNAGREATLDLCCNWYTDGEKRAAKGGYVAATCLGFENDVEACGLDDFGDPVVKESGFDGIRHATKGILRKAVNKVVDVTVNFARKVTSNAERCVYKTQPDHDGKPLGRAMACWDTVKAVSQVAFVIASLVCLGLVYCGIALPIAAAGWATLRMMVDAGFRWYDGEHRRDIQDAGLVIFGIAATATGLAASILSEGFADSEVVEAIAIDIYKLATTGAKTVTQKLVESCYFLAEKNEKLLRDIYIDPAKVRALISRNAEASTCEDIKSLAFAPASAQCQSHLAGFADFTPI
eukprot:TRINITY_DN35365_c0_g3_i1.p1 TRINITY_DN35365_c0_g3~~TRINITY_DN35365_c0_g3_i1.p1  ORF type:complete len:424 (+),score=34.50 TRINITY_DN35365_c0_g3_i1:141-1412(+)